MLEKSALHVLQACPWISVVVTEAPDVEKLLIFACFY